MRVLTVDPPPAELQAVLERRRQIGADTRDEIWDGVLHMAPAAHSRHADVQAQLLELFGPLARAAGVRTRGEFNVGEPDNFRVPDGGLLMPGPGAVFHPTAPMVFEVVAPDDETWDKLPFYASHDVHELLVVDPQTRKIDWLGLRDGAYEPIERSGLIDLSVEQLGGLIDWPPLDD
jgi:hypothetical protein